MSSSPEKPSAGPSADPSQTRSLAEPSVGTDARPGGAGSRAPADRSERSSPTERSSAADADIGTSDADVPLDPPEFSSLAELFFRHPLDEERRDVTPAAMPPEDSSLTEPVSEPPPAAANPWRRSADHEELMVRARTITLLISRWELGTVHRLHALAAYRGLGVREFLVLSELVVRPAGLTAAQLTGVVGGGAARMSVLLRELEVRGLVDRGPDPFDSRSVIVGATDQACEFLPHQPAPHLRRLVELQLSGGEQADVVTRFVGAATDMAYANSRDLRELRGWR